MKTCERLRKIKALDDYIKSQMNQLQKLESQALKINASPLQADKVQNGNRKKRDDLYIELISTREEIEEYIAEAMKQSVLLGNKSLKFQTWKQEVCCRWFTLTV